MIILHIQIHVKRRRSGIEDLKIIYNKLETSLVAFINLRRGRGVHGTIIPRELHTICVKIVVFLVFLKAVVLLLLLSIIVTIYH